MSCPAPVGLIQVAATAGLHSQAAGGHPIVLTKVAEIVAHGLRVGGEPVLVVGSATLFLGSQSRLCQAGTCAGHLQADD